MKTIRRRNFLVAAPIGALLAIALPGAVAPSRAQGVESPPTRSIKIATTEVTDPDVAVSADGSWLVFTALGHLFQLPAAGGAAKQLTSGPFYDAAPAISPDQTKVAFISDRKISSQGNVFVLDLASGQIRQVTDEFWVDRPVWSPDGKSLVFLSFQRVGPVGNYWFVGPGMLKSQVRRVGLADGKVETLTEPGFVHAVAFLADGRPVWSVVEPETKGKPVMSRLEVLSQQGKVTTALTVEGVVDRIAVDPGDARGLYLRLYKTAAVMNSIAPQPEHLAHVTLSDGGPLTVSGLLSRPADWTHDVEDRGAGARVYVAQLSNPLPRPAFGAAKGAIYLGEKGKLWRIDAATGKRDEVTFSADIAFDFYPGSPPPVYSEKRSASPTSILTPRLAPDGASVIFTAAGFLWRQPLAGGAARRLLDTGGFEWGPAALSPDGKKIAYQLSEGDAQQLRIVDLATGQSSILESQGRTGRYEPAWSPDGTKLVYTHFEPGPPSYAQKVPGVYLADLVSGKQQKLVDGSPRWQPAAQFSGDGKWVYFTANGQIHRHSTEPRGASQPITALTGFAANGQVSPDGKWVAFRRNDEIWMAPRGTQPVKDAAAFRFSPSGGQQFSFTPDGEAFVYATGAEVWLHPLKDGGQRQVDVRLKLSTEPPPPVLLRNVRVLDFKAGSFTEATSLFVANGRIEWIGAEADHTLPSNLAVVDGGGRFAIPGLFDMHAHTATPIHLQTARDVSRMEAWIAHGVTSVRDMGSDIATLNAWSDRRTAFAAAVPRVFSYGSMIEEAPFIWGGSVFGASDEQMRDLVRVEKQAGVVGVKSYFTLSWPLHRAVAAEALKQGLPVAAHGLARQEIIRGVLVGHADEEHMIPVNVYYDDLLQLLKATGTHWTPTLALAFSVIPEGSPLHAGMLAELKRAYQAGVALHPGTGAANPRDNYGQALQAELQNFARAGIPPIEVLRIATQRSAEWVGAGDVLGSLEPGKLADIVLLDANPLDDIANTQTIWRVVAGGKVFAEPYPLPASDETEPDEDSTDAQPKN
jgi:Tol biopolymer transport system component/imidazolonepropionase-like amidohydrolase